MKRRGINEHTKIGSEFATETPIKRNHANKTRCVHFQFTEWHINNVATSQLLRTNSIAAAYSSIAA